MEPIQRLQWLRRILVVKVVLCVAVWGLPALWASPALLRWFGLPVPQDPLFLRSFGALAITMGVAYWYAYRDPVRNEAILRVGVIDNALATAIVLFTVLTSGVSSWFLVLTGVLTAGFFLALLLLPASPSTQEG